MIKEIFSAVEYVAKSLGMGILKSKVKDGIEKKQIEKKFDDFLSRKIKENEYCSKDEELDFIVLTEYIHDELYEDVMLYIYGNKEERERARKSVLNNVIYYSQAKTKLSKEKVVHTISDAIKILKDFYIKKVPKEFKILGNQMVDEVCENTGKQVRDSEKRIIDAMENKTLLSIDKNIALLNEGKVDEMCKNFNDAIKAIGASHQLYPDFKIGFRQNDSKMELWSVPSTSKAFTEYTPTLKLGVSANIGVRRIQEFTFEDLQYSFRHQIPIDINVKEAVKLLGKIEDPFQYEAKTQIGKKYKLIPPAFPEAFACSIVGNQGTIIDYLLLRTKEILDDDIYVITNEEQKDSIFKIRILLNMNKKLFTFNISNTKKSNIAQLTILRYLKAMQDSTNIKIHLLSSNTDLCIGTISDKNVTTILNTIDDDIIFFEKIILIEKYLKVPINLPDKISENDITIIEYIGELLKGEPCDFKWDNYAVQLELDQKIKEFLLSQENSGIRLQIPGDIQTELFGHKVSLPIVKSYLCAKIVEYDKLKDKLKILDFGDIIKIHLTPGEFSDIMQERLDKERYRL